MLRLLNHLVADGGEQGSLSLLSQLADSPSATTSFSMVEPAESSTAASPDSSSNQAPRRRSRRRSVYAEMRYQAAVRVQGLLFIIRAKAELRGRRRNRAATRIQALQRGRVARQQQRPRIEEQTRVLAVEAVQFFFQGRPLAEVPTRFRAHVAAIRLQRQARRLIARAVLARVRSDQFARKIQRTYRRATTLRLLKSLRTRLKEDVRRAKASTSISRVFRGFIVRKRLDDGMRAELANTRLEEYALRHREQRVKAVGNDTQQMATAIDHQRRAAEEKHVLDMVLASADPNCDVVRWSAERTTLPALRKKNTAPPRLPPIATIPAQGRTDDERTFAPQPQALEPGLQAVLLTEPTSLLASTATLNRVSRKARNVALKRMEQRYRGLPAESETMRYVLLRDSPSKPHRSGSQDPS